MNSKLLYYIAFGGILLTGCTSISKIPVPKGIDNTIRLPEKKGVLTETQMQRWSHADLEKDTVPGMSIKKAYQFLKNKKGVEVIVAIADSGVDIEHEDLKDVAWVNPKELTKNKKDDDKNGYVDDVHGWNFLGNASGKIINEDQLEITRIVKKGMDTFGNKKEFQIPESQKKAFKKFQKLKKVFEAATAKTDEEKKQIAKTEARLKELEASFSAVKKYIGKESYTIDDLKKTTPTSPILAAQIAEVSGLLSRGLSEKALLDYKKQLLDYKQGLEKGRHYDLDFDARQTLGDNLYDINDQFYGNNNVIGSKDKESHGTHVAGIVGASRDNGKGVNGVANNVKIMTVRVVPDGDEHDKDVALGIRYAVDNGAKIINTSFGKRYSPNKQWVYEAIQYAAKKNVLIVNAAGNDGKNIDLEKTFPNDSKDLKIEISDNVLTVGAMSVNYNENLPANFSNYGKINVDVFAPGVAIYAPVPKDEYVANSGTSMAAPSASGIAALIRSYYPKLSASQVKYILMNSGIKINFDVIKPGTENEKVPFAELCVSGRIVNAYNALKMADKIVSRRK